jgi:hypothetical protein
MDPRLRPHNTYLYAACVALAACLAACGGSTPTPTPSTTTAPPTASPTPSPVATLAGIEFTLPSGFFPTGLVAGPDNNLWVSEYAAADSGGAIAKVTTAGVATNYAVPSSAAAGPITLGSDNALWFPFEGANGAPSVNMGRISTSGVVTAYPLPNTDTDIVSIASGSDGNLWYLADGVDNSGDSALRAFSPTSESIVANLALPMATYGTPGSMVSNPSGGSLVIATSGSPGGLLKVTPSLTPTASFAYQAPVSDTGTFSSLAVGGGIIWGLYTSPSGGTSAQQLLNVNESTYAVSYISLPNETWDPGSPGCSPGYCPLVFAGPIALGPDGNLYFWSTDTTADPKGVAVGVVAVSQSGELLAFYNAQSLAGASNEGLVVGPDGNIWSANSDGRDSSCCLIAIEPAGKSPATRPKRR